MESTSESDNKHDFRTITLFVTTGRGTEKFVEEELKEKLNCPVEHIRDGKVFFTVPHSQLKKHKIFALKSVERIFVAITNYQNRHFIKDKRTFLNKLMYELSASHNFTNAEKVIEELKMSSKIDSFYRTCHQNCKSHNFSDECCSNNTNNLSMKTHSSGISNVISSRVEAPPLKKQKIADCELEKSKLEKTPSTDLKGNALNYSVEQESDVYGNTLTCRLQKDTFTEGAEENLTTFRISIKCSGKVKRWLDLKRLSKDLAWRITKASGWKVDLQHPNFEVCVHISDEYLTAGIPLTKFPLSKREYFVDPGLRSTIAWIMSYLAKIKPDDIVLDPMCGKATVLIEASSEFKALLYLGSDSDTNQLMVANQNICSCTASQSALSLVKADGLNMPYRDRCIDVVLCDAPFNQNHKIHQDSIELFYLQFLKEIYRVLAPDGRCILLVPHDMKEILINKLISSRNQEADLVQVCELQSVSHIPFIHVDSHSVKLGETQAFLIVLKK